MATLLPQQLLAAFQWRYATKAFDPSRKIAPETWEALEQSLVLSPSSYGLQPYRFLVVTADKVRADLLQHSWGQRQVVEASHLVVFLARTGLTEADVDRLVARTTEVRGVPAAALKGYRDIMVSDLVKGPRSAAIHDWAARQAYIAFGNLLTSAALLGVDACPLEGIVPSEYDRILGLAGSGYATVVAAALGYRAAEDRYATLPKVRFPAKELIQHIN